MNTYYIARLKSGNVAVEDRNNKVIRHSCLVVTGTEAGKFLDGTASVPCMMDWMEVQAPDARTAADMLNDAIAQRQRSDMSVRDDLVRQFSVTSYDRDMPFTAIQRRINGLKKSLCDLQSEFAAFKLNPAALKKALKSAELKEAKAKAEAKMKAAILKAIAPLKAKSPKAPLKGSGHNRVDFAKETPLEKMFFDLMPASHRDEVSTRRSKNNFTWTRVISPEAARAFARLAAKMSA